MDSDLEEVKELLNCLEAVEIDTETDKLIWGPGTTEEFSVKECYKQLAK